MPAGGLPSPLVRAAGAGAGDGCASPRSSAILRRFSLSADADGEGWSSFVASAAVEARSASAASAANLLVALPLAPPPVAGALRAALTGRRSPTAAGPGRAGLEISNMASRARFPSAFSGVNTSALATSATSSDSPPPAMSVQKRPMYRPAVCISSSIAVAGTRARDH